MVSKCLLGSAVLVTVNVILLIVLLGVTVTWLHGTRPTDYQRKEQNISIVVQQELRTLTGFSQASDIFRVQQDLTHIYGRDGNLDKPAIHLTIAGPVHAADDVPVLSLQSQATSQGVYHHNGTVTVSHGGYYYIYSNIRYRGNGTTELDYGRILHSVLMQKESEMEESPTVLMQNLQSTPTIRRGRLAYTTSSLGSTFYLPPRARVMVTSSIPRNIDTSSTGSYFGLYLT